MEKTVKILLLQSVAGRSFAYGKGENDVPESLAASLVKSGLAEYIGSAKKPHETAERAISQQAKKSEKR